jgi:uncharacterized integral membrane protein
MDAEPPVTPAASAPPTEATLADRAAAPVEPRAPDTRTSGTFASLMAGVIVLALLLVFILENTQRVKISFFGASGHLPLGVALLIAAVAGALLVGIVASVRIVQLRRRAKRTAKRP